MTTKTKAFETKDALDLYKKIIYTEGKAGRRMDGFDTEETIIVLAATNRPEMLDKALLRPGRFDRQITIALPDLKGREEILKIHAKEKKFANDVNLKNIAEDTAGFTGAELANILNEAAIIATIRKMQ